MNPLFVVDDDASYRELLLLTLEDECGVERVVGCPSGRAFLRELATALASGDPPVLVILDLHMPDCSGLELLGEIQLMAPRLPVAFLSGAAAPDERDAGLAAGAVAFLRKPVAYGELIRMLQDLVRSVAQGSGPAG